MLAQAQKCFYEKAERGGMKAGVLMKIAAECAALYAEVSYALNGAHAKASISADWFEVIEWNKLLFDGMQHYYASFAHLEQKEYGAQLARLTYATNRCARY